MESSSSSRCSHCSFWAPNGCPWLAQQAAKALHDLRRWTQRTREDIGRELGPEFENFDLADLNPKNFVKKHLLDPLADDDDEKPLTPNTYGPRALSSSLPGNHTAVGSLGKSAADQGPNRTVSLGGVLSDHDVAADLLDGTPVAVGPDVTTDVFAEPRGLSAAPSRSRSTLNVPMWEDTSSALSAGRYDRLDDSTTSEGAADVDDEATAYDASFYLPPPFDIDAT